MITPMALAERPRFRHRIRAVLLVICLLAVSWLGYAAWFRINYGSLPGQTPARIHWCGRDYAVAGSPTATLIEGAPLGQRIATVPHLWSNWPLYATVDPAARTTDRPCSMTLYLKTAPDRYVDYGLEGGP